MADGPQDYRDPKVTTTERGGAPRWLWPVLGAIVVLLLLAWLLGWFGGDDDPEAVEDGAVAVEPAEEPAVEAEPAEGG